MRTEFINLFAEINATELENLTREIKETVAIEMHVENEKPVFTAADLWNIHNMKRTRATRRNYIS
jgi:hypothetical protein